MLSTIFRKLPSFKGKLRLANMLINRNNVTNIQIQSRVGKFVLPNVTDNQYFELYVNGIYEKKVVEYLIANIPDKGVFLDIGANIGSISIPVALARPDVTIVCIEALPLNYQYLTENLKLNKINNIKPLNICCSFESGQKVRFYFDEKMNGNSSFHSIHTNQFVELVTSTIDEELSKLGIAKVDVVKIDTEGSEALIFRGAMDTLQKSKPKILFEFIAEYEGAIKGLSVGDSQNLLRGLGYSLYSFREYPNGSKINETLSSGGLELLALSN